jgi:hypothetical protein
LTDRDEVQGLLSPADDDFHEPPDDSWWFHETCWFWFFVPERRIGGWLYSWIRPNIGVCGGGCWVWDDTTFLHWEVPYYSCFSNLPLPAERDLRNMVFPTGMSVRAVEPLRRYRLGYGDGDRIAVDLTFDALMEPWVTTTDGPGEPRPVHLDQLGRVTGRLVLHGEALEVDCLAIRDRTWTLRSERWRSGGGYGYTNAAAATGEAFLAVGDERALRGYHVAEGRRAALVEGARHVERDPDHGYVTRIRIEASDELGRALQAEGTPVSRMAMPIPGVHGLVWTSLTSWTIDGIPAWGEDQEPWPIAVWSERRRSQC